MNLRHLDCVIALADELHFGRAAERLHIGQASVSEAVSSLERTLGAPLFRRSTRRVEMTPVGEQFLATVRLPYEQLREAIETARATNHGSGELLVGHTPELGHLIFPRLVAKLGEEGARSDLRWSPRLIHTHQQLNGVIEGTIDLGICWQPKVAAPLRATVLARCPFVAIMRSDDPMAMRPDLHLSDLRGRRLLVTPRADNRFIEAQLEFAFSSAGMTTKCLDEVSRYDELAIRVVAQSSIGLHPATIRLINHVPGVVFREIVESNLDLEISVISRRDMGAASDAFVELLRAVALEALGEVLQTLDEDLQRSPMTPTSQQRAG